VIFFQNAHPTLAGAVTDILNIFDIDTACEGDSAKRDKFYFITREVEQVKLDIFLISISIVTSSFLQYLTEKLLKERLEIDTLQDVGTVKNKTFYTKFIKVKTKL
jgi:THO complex subunit 2